MDAQVAAERTPQIVKHAVGAMRTYMRNRETSDLIVISTIAIDPKAYFAEYETFVFIYDGLVNESGNFSRELGNFDGEIHKVHHLNPYERTDKPLESHSRNVRYFAGLGYEFCGFARWNRQELEKHGLPFKFTAVA